MNQAPIDQEEVSPVPKATRDLFVRGVPKDIWDRLHINAIRSGLRLKNYLIQVLDSAQPLPPHESDP